MHVYWVCWYVEPSRSKLKLCKYIESIYFWCNLNHVYLCWIVMFMIIVLMFTYLCLHNHIDLFLIIMFMFIYTIRNLVVGNPSLCDYVQSNLTCNYKWLPMQLLFKFGWNLVFFSTRLQLWPISSLNCIIFYNVFVFFTTLYIHLVVIVTNTVTC